jgi:predicted transport protein
MPKKRDMPGGFKQSPLKLNAGLGTLTKWTEDEIKDRAKKLASESLGIWVAPRLDGVLLKSYQEEPEAKSTYTIDDHPHLASGPMRNLFEEFRMAVQSLDPCIAMEFRKLYIAFKAETNFVDVIPQAKRLRLSLNIPFSDLNDPKGICRDITGKGRWGNGDVDVGISSKEEIPYVLGLVRQAFERQMLD